MSMADSRRNQVEDLRPLSPHLQIYRFTPTMTMSILHRITGVGMYLGMILFVFWLLLAACSPTYFQATQALLLSFAGQALLFCFSWAAMNHGLGGIRHLIWDTGRGLEGNMPRYLALATAAGGLLFTLALWVLIWTLQ